MEPKYDVLIMTTPRDFLRLKSNYHRLVKNMPAKKLIFVGNVEVGELTNRLALGERVSFIHEDDILPFGDVHRIMQDVLQREDVPRGVTGWYYQQLDEPQTYSELMPKFMQELKAVDKHEKMPELLVILEENFIKDSDGKWYIPDLTKAGDVAKLREKNLLKEFQEYLNGKGKLKTFRLEAIKVGFAKLWKDKDYQSIVKIAERLPESTVQEDPNILMYYDISLSRV